MHRRRSQSSEFPSEPFEGLGYWIGCCCRIIVGNPGSVNEVKSDALWRPSCAVIAPPRSRAEWAAVSIWITVVVRNEGEEGVHGSNP